MRAMYRAYIIRTQINEDNMEGTINPSMSEAECHSLVHLVIQGQWGFKPLSSVIQG